MVSIISMEFQHNGIQFHASKQVSLLSREMVDKAKKLKPENENKVETKSLKTGDNSNKDGNENLLVNLMPTGNNVKEGVTREKAPSKSLISVKQASSPSSVALISSFYQSELDLTKTMLPPKDTKLLHLLAKR